MTRDYGTPRHLKFHARFSDKLVEGNNFNTGGASMGFFEKAGGIIGSVAESSAKSCQRRAYQMEEKLENVDRNRLSDAGKEKYDAARENVDRWKDADPKEIGDDIREFGSTIDRSFSKK